jgi:hypothetical protein
MVLPNYVSAEGSWETPDSTNMFNNDDLQWAGLLDTIKSAINWLLAMLATIAVAICLYAGFLMVTSAWDEKKYEKGLTILKYAAIGLVIVWLSWLIVSVVYWLLGFNAEDGKMIGWGGDTAPSK